MDGWKTINPFFWGEQKASFQGRSAVSFFREVSYVSFFQERMFGVFLAKSVEVGRGNLRGAKQELGGLTLTTWMSHL